MKKIMIKYICACVYHTSIKSNDKCTAVEEQILLLLGRFPTKPSRCYLTLVYIFHGLIDGNNRSE